MPCNYKFGALVSSLAPSIASTQPKLPSDQKPPKNQFSAGEVVRLMCGSGLVSCFNRARARLPPYFQDERSHAFYDLNLKWTFS